MTARLVGGEDDARENQGYQARGPFIGPHSGFGAVRGALARVLCTKLIHMMLPMGLRS